MQNFQKLLNVHVQNVNNNEQFLLVNIALPTINLNIEWFNGVLRK